MASHNELFRKRDRSQESIDTKELPAIPRPDDPDSQELERIRSAAFRTIQFEASQVEEQVQETVPVSNAESIIRKAIEEALIVVLETLKKLAKDEIFKEVETIPIYSKDMTNLLRILQEGEIGTKGLLFHLNQKCQILEAMVMEFGASPYKSDLEQSLEICKESKIKLLQKIKG